VRSALADLLKEINRHLHGLRDLGYMAAGHHHGLGVHVMVEGDLGGALAGQVEVRLLRTVVDPYGALEAGGKGQRRAHLEFRGVGCIEWDAVFGAGA